MLKTLILLAAGNLAVSAIIAALVILFAPWMSPLALYDMMSPIMLLLAGALVTLAIVGGRAGLAGNHVRVRKAATLAVAVCVLGAVYGELNTHFGWLIDNVINFETLAPMRIASLSMLLLGLLAAMVAVGLFQFRSRGPHN